ncbi:MAG: hypothetical protein COZ11_12325 [Deltaproteobacteria bacterium CG_4_10_14_3_um_filter_51_14]|nr:MAG: hypothetical protein COZ11_12325 [Deltaproteobacteria bacterium CG_4_10_14_3_um_filter_51_14]
MEEDDELKCGNQSRVIESSQTGVRIMSEGGDAQARVLLQQIIDFLPDATFVIDRQGVVIAWNRAMERLTRIKAEDMLGKGDLEYSLAFYNVKRPVLIDLVNNSDLDILSKYEYVRREGETLISETPPYTHLYGGNCYLNIACPLYDRKGEVIGAIECIRDITEQKQAERALKESEERFKLTFYSSPDAIILGRMQDAMWVDINEGFSKLSGYRREEVIGKTSFELEIWANPEDRDKMIKELTRKGFCENLEAVFRRRDGTVGTGLISSRVIFLGKVPHIISVTRDITAMKEADEERKRLEAQLIQAQKMESVGRLAGGIAHDFNNMLGVILGRAELALSRSEPGGKLHSDLLDIQKAARRSADLTKQLLGFARRQTTEPKVLDLNDTISGMLKMLRRMIGEDIDLAFLPGLDVRQVKMDPAQLDQILANLCVNARDAIDDVGKITIETENAMLTYEDFKDKPYAAAGRYVSLIVSDTGCGMAKDVVEKIFEPFFTTKEVGKGTGLGLAKVYAIVKQNEGYINVYSEPGKGTTFKIYLPAQGYNATQGQIGDAEEEIIGGDETVLLVEDEPMLLEMGEIMLKRLGYDVFTANGPGQALETVKRCDKDIALLITDVVMPEMNGMELSERLCSLKPGIRCLFTSGYTANVIARHGVLKEGVSFIQKPLLLKDLAVKIRSILDTKVHIPAANNER